MPDYQRDNPYASPQTAVEPMEGLLSEMDVTWRDGDEIALLPGGSRAPEACWVTNESRWIVNSPLVDDAPAVLLVFGLFQIPVVGFVLAVAAAFTLTVLGKMPRESVNYARLSWRLGALRFAVAFATGILFVLGFVLSNVAFGLLCSGAAIGGLSMSVFAILIVGLHLYAYGNRDRLVLGLEARREGHLVRVRGVHPDYLSRLPPWPGSEV